MIGRILLPCVTLAPLHPKNVGRLFMPRALNVSCPGTYGNEVLFIISELDRMYVAASAIPLGHFWVSELDVESTANTTST